MNELIPIVSVTPQGDFAAMQFSRSKTGHVHSPWWSYNWRKYDKGPSPYIAGSYFHHLRSRSMSAFAYALGLRERDVFCSQRENAQTSELEWRIGTINPCELPKPKKPKLNTGLPAIDI